MNWPAVVAFMAGMIVWQIGYGIAKRDNRIIAEWSWAAFFLAESIFIGWLNR